MTDHLDPRPEVHVREHPMPGNAQLFELTLANGSRLTVATEPQASTRELSITLLGHDEPAASVTLRDAEATTLAALLSGIRLVIERLPPDETDDIATLHTLAIGASSPAVGRRLDQIGVPSPDDATVIAVIRDDTPDLVEQEDQRPCQPGDRLVLVGRPDPLRELIRYLLG